VVSKPIASPGMRRTRLPNFLSPVRMGWMQYLNTFPMWLAAQQLIQRDAWPKVHEQQGHPTELNQALQQGHLDVSLVSTAAWFQHSHHWECLPPLCIASYGPVNSVLWLHTRAFHPERHALCVSSASASSVALLRFIVQQRMGMPTHQQAVAPGVSWRDALAHHQNVLLIGDSALQVYADLLRTGPSDIRVWDLAQAWQEQTGHPFVFGVWAASPPYALHYGAALRGWMNALAEETIVLLKDPAMLFEHCQQEQGAKLEGLSREQVMDYWCHRLVYTLTVSERIAALDTMQTLLGF
jgi:chorismate dehydratase